MKTYLSLCLLTLLLACGESRIESVDDEVLEQANADKAAADLKLAQSALLGDWTFCAENEDGTSARSDYTFGSDSKARVQQAAFSTKDCTGDDADTTSVSIGWKLVPVKDTDRFALHLSWGEGKKLESEYTSNGMQAELPNLMKLKDEANPAPIKLTEKDRFLKLDKVKPSNKDELLTQSEKMLMTYADGLVRRKGSWQSACADSKITSLTFSGTKDLKLSIERSSYEDKECKKLKEVESKSTVDFKLKAVADLKQMTLDADLGTEQRKLKVSFSNVDSLGMSEAGERSNVMTSYTFQGVSP